MANTSLNKYIENERLWSFVFWLIILIVIDQLTKIGVFASLYSTKIFRVGSAEILGLTLFENLHFAFSLPLPQIIIYGIYFFVLTLITIYLVKHFVNLSKFELWSWILICAGALANVFERLIRGSVRDYLYIYGGGILNLADLYILAGIVMLFIFEIKHKKTLE